MARNKAASEEKGNKTASCLYASSAKLKQIQETATPALHRPIRILCRKVILFRLFN